MCCFIRGSLESVGRGLRVSVCFNGVATCWFGLSVWSKMRQWAVSNLSFRWEDGLPRKYLGPTDHSRSRVINTHA